MIHIMMGGFITGVIMIALLWIGPWETQEYTLNGFERIVTPRSAITTGDQP